MRVLHRYVEVGNPLTPRRLWPSTTRSCSADSCATCGARTRWWPRSSAYRSGETGGDGCRQPGGDRPQGCATRAEAPRRRAHRLFYQHRVDPRSRSRTWPARWPSWCAKARTEPPASRGGPGDVGARTPSIPSPRCRANTRGRASRRRAVCSRPAARSGSAPCSCCSPLGRGFLTGAIQKPSDMAAEDWRHTNPRFQGAAFDKNSGAGCARQELRGTEGLHARSSSRWPGFWLRGTTSYPSRAPSA